MRYTPLATDALCHIPTEAYAISHIPARAPHVTEKGYKFYGESARSNRQFRLATRQTSQKGEFGSVCHISKSPYKGKSCRFACWLPIKSHFFSQLFS